MVFYSELFMVHIQTYLNEEQNFSQKGEIFFPGNLFFLSGLAVAYEPEGKTKPRL